MQIEDESPPPHPIPTVHRLEPSAAQSWILFFCWTLPGLSLIGSAALGFFLTYSGGSQWDFLVTLFVFGFPLITAIGCGIFASIINLTQYQSREAVRPWPVASKTLSFVFLQVVVAPMVAFALGLGCSAVITTIS